MEKFRESEQGFVAPPVVNGPSSDGIVRSTTDFGPAHFLLKIESYSLLLKTGVESYESGIFEAGEHKWNLCFYPTGNSKSEGNGHISLYLKLAETEFLPCGWKIKAKFKFFVFDQLRKKYLAIHDGDQGIRRFDKTNTEWGLAQLLSLETFTDHSKGYLLDDCCILGAEVLVIRKPRRMECFSLVKKLLKYDSIYTWNIDNFSALDKEFYFSEGFTSLQGTVWRLLVYPKGRSFSKGEGLSVYLHYDGGLPSNQKVYAEFKLRVKKQYANMRRLGKRKLVKQRSNLGNQRIMEYTGNHWFSASSRNFGCCHLISLKHLEKWKGYLLNDRLIVEVEIVAMSRIKCCPIAVGT